MLRCVEILCPAKESCLVKFSLVCQILLHNVFCHFFHKKFLCLKGLNLLPPTVSITNISVYDNSEMVKKGPQSIINQKIER